MSAEDAAPAARPIRRYGNRKLYDPLDRRYVTLEDLGELVSRGHELSVTDQSSGEDLTNPTLTQVLLEEMKRGATRVPGQVLTRLIRLARGPASAWSHWPEPRDAAGRAREEAEKIVARLLGSGRLRLDDAVALRQELGQLVHRLVTEAQSGVEARLRALLVKGEGVAGRSLEALKGGLEAIESYLEPEAPEPPKPARRRGAARTPARTRSKSRARSK
jgi:polyhydroxyalkanoate synthesis repressor PhaR